MSKTLLQDEHSGQTGYMYILKKLEVKSFDPKGVPKVSALPSLVNATMQEIEEGFMRMHNNNDEEEWLEADHDMDWDTKDGRTARRMQNSVNTLGNHSELVKWLSRFLAIKH